MKYSENNLWQFTTQENTGNSSSEEEIGYDASTDTELSIKFHIP
jgi:hypothetical protein